MFILRINVEVFRWDPDEGKTDILNFWDEEPTFNLNDRESITKYIFDNFNIDNMKFEDDIIKIEEKKQNGPDYELKVYNIRVLEFNNITEEFYNLEMQQNK